ncbi:hypothetical protein CLF_102044 [Clonorchis sinensis]|uniref:Uncharacterized protein n=1 Tax=Clonorchis sinensis TaxID=79923 RepID=G7Y759_CLOSI|nr:hypothetical protein CLF_102044 [Clonorchis sinensis]
MYYVCPTIVYESSCSPLLFAGAKSAENRLRTVNEKWKRLLTSGFRAVLDEVKPDVVQRLRSVRELEKNLYLLFTLMGAYPTPETLKRTPRQNNAPTYTKLQAVLEPSAILRMSTDQMRMGFHSMEELTEKEDSNSKSGSQDMNKQQKESAEHRIALFDWSIVDSTDPNFDRLSSTLGCRYVRKPIDKSRPTYTCNGNSVRMLSQLIIFKFPSAFDYGDRIDRPQDQHRIALFDWSIVDSTDPNFDRLSSTLGCRYVRKPIDKSRPTYTCNGNSVRMLSQLIIFKFPSAFDYGDRIDRPQDRVHLSRRDWTLSWYGCHGSTRTTMNCTYPNKVMPRRPSRGAISRVALLATYSRADKRCKVSNTRVQKTSEENLVDKEYADDIVLVFEWEKA